MNISLRLEHAAHYTALISGVMLFVFASVELCSYAVGLISLEEMGDLAARQMALNRSWPGSALLLAACAGHAGAALWLTARRATLRMSLRDAAQILSGLFLPLLLLPYLIDTRVANALFSVEDDVLYRLTKLWPEHAVFYVILIVLLWGHGCLGLHQWLKLKRGYRTIAPVLAVAALAVPIAAVAGLVASARVASVLMTDDTFAAQVRAATHWPPAEAEDTLWRWRLIAMGAYGGLLLISAGAMAARFLNILVAPKIDVTYVNGPKLKASSGPTLLEISLIHGVPHAASCGGRGRCTACSVRIEEGEASLPPQTPAEIEMLDADLRIRLACQIRPRSALTITRLTPAAGTIIVEPELDMTGVERQVAALCVELRNQAKLVSGRRAYDAIFLLNEFLDMAHAAVTKHNGSIVRTAGGGIVALFRRNEDAKAISQDAIAAAAEIDAALDRLNERFAAELGQPIAIAMGLAFGAAYLGRIGPGPSKPFSAVGPVIDAASALAGHMQERGGQLLSDPAVFQAAGIEASGMELVQLNAKNGVTRMVLATDHARLSAPAAPAA